MRHVQKNIENYKDDKMGCCGDNDKLKRKILKLKRKLKRDYESGKITYQEYSRRIYEIKNLFGNR